MFNQYSIHPDYWRENELVKEDARDSRHEVCKCDGRLCMSVRGTSSIQVRINFQVEALR